MKSQTNPPKRGKIVIYPSKSVEDSFEVRLEDETVWLTQEQLVQLFNRDKSAISRHISNVFKEKELQRNRTVAKYATVQTEGKREVIRNIEYFNLDVIKKKIC